MSEPVADNNNDGAQPLDPADGTVNDLSTVVTAAERPLLARVAALCVCAALVFGLGGFLVGRGTNSDEMRKLQAANSLAVKEKAALNETIVNGADTGSLFAPNFGGKTSASVGDSQPGGWVGRQGGGAGMYAPNAYEEPKQELITERTTTSGITMRAHLQDYGTLGTPYLDQFGSWTPAGWCFPTGNLRISIVTASAVNISGASWFSEPKGGSAISTFSAGYAEGSPVFGAAVQVGAGITSVTFTTASGLTDTAAVVRGVALLAVNGPIEQDFTVTLTSADGTTSSQSNADLSLPYDGSDYAAACEPPPPALPSAGAQPADAVAAEAAVRESWTVARDFNNADSAARLARIDDTTGIADAWQALSTGEFAEAAKTSSTTIQDFAFSSPTEAWFRYDVTTTMGNFTNRYGKALLGDDGVWRITRQTVCQDLGLAPGSQCTPPVDNLYPPSAANDPRYGQGGVIGISSEPRPAVDPIAVDVAPQK